MFHGIQSNDSGKFKVDLNVDKHREFTDRALIGGDSSANGNPNSGDINIYGGNLDLKTHGFSTAAMIGGAKGGSLNRFAMYGGTLTAVHGGSGAGIGGSKRAKDKGGYGGNITISSGSKVVATSSDYGEAQDLVNRLDGYIDHSGMKTDDIA